MIRELSEDERIVDDFFQEWLTRNNVPLTTGEKAKYDNARRAWKRYSEECARAIYDCRGLVSAQREIADFHKRKADEWLTALQAERIKNVGDYTHRFFIRRPKMRRFVQFLMKL